jgi:dCMP deaminase
VKRPDWDTYFLGICEAVAERADCTRRKVGAVIVRDHRIVSTGYNGSPAGQPGCLTDGACPRGRLRDELAGEVNTSAVRAGFSSYDTGPGACIAVHAEENAIIYADYEKCRGATLYCTDTPCAGCAKLIAGTGIGRVVTDDMALGLAYSAPYENFYRGTQSPVDKPRVDG